MVVARVPIPACGIRLPHLDEHVGQWPSVLVDDAARDDDAFALRLAARVLAREVVVGRADGEVAVHRLREIGVDGRQLDQGLLRRAQHRRLVRRIEQRRLALPNGLGVGGQGR